MMRTPAVITGVGPTRHTPRPAQVAIAAALLAIHDAELDVNRMCESMLEPLCGPIRVVIRPLPIAP